MATTIIYSDNPGTVSGSPTDTIVLNASTGTAVKSGSFASASTAALTKLASIPGPTCGTGPFTAFTIAAGDISV